MNPVNPGSLICVFQPLDRWRTGGLKINSLYCLHSKKSHRKVKGASRGLTHWRFIVSAPAMPSKGRVYRKDWTGYKVMIFKLFRRNGIAILNSASNFNSNLLFLPNRANCTVSITNLHCIHLWSECCGSLYFVFYQLISIVFYCLTYHILLWKFRVVFVHVIIPESSKLELLKILYVFVCCICNCIFCFMLPLFNF